jgi:putative NADH-flavin reductase
MAKIVVIGASRGIGLELLDQAFQQGHSVTALFRNPQKFSMRHERLRTVIGNVADQESMNKAVAGQDVICWTVGIKPTWKNVTIFSEGTKHMLQAMEDAKVRRLICVTGIGVGESRGHGGFFYDWIVNPLLLKKIYKDKERQEELIRASNTDWIIVRPGFLTNGPLTRRYRALTDLSGVRAGKISRADVANFMLENITSKEYVGKSLLLTY